MSERSDFRYALYRKRSGNATAVHDELCKRVEPLIPRGETWSTFAKKWDVFVANDGSLTVIKPEDDYAFVLSTCLERSLCARRDIEMDMSPRQANVIQIVELHMLDGKMTWENFNKAWTVNVDKELKRISTHLAATVVNEVTDDMIRNSAKSDGSPHRGTPGVEPLQMSDPIPMTDEEVAAINELMRTRTANNK